MKKKIVFLLAIMTMLVLLTVGLTIGTAADGEVAKNTSTNATYHSISEAISAASNGDTIEVIADTSISSTVEITKTVTLTSSNGSTITATVDNIFSVGADESQSGDLTIEGNLTITYNQGTILYMVNGTLTVQGNATLKSGWTTIRMASDGGMVANCYVYIKDNAVVEAISTNEDDNVLYVNDGTRANLYIQGGTVRHTAGRGISFPAGNIEVSDGLLTAKYGIYVWYNAGSAVKTITVSGGTVEGSETGIYFNTNAKNCTLAISGGTVKGNTHAIDYRSDQDPSNNAINISGGTLTAPGQTTFFYRCTALNVTVTGGTIEATSGSLTVYGAELRGDLTLSVSGSSQITATGDNTINVTMPGNTSTYPGILKATIADGTISAGGEHAVNVQNGSVTMTGGTVSAGSVAIYGNKTGGSISISGGTVRTTTGGNTIAFDGAGTRTLNISGTAQIIAAGSVAILGTASATPTITITGGTITAGGDFCIDTRGGTVNISNGTLATSSTWGFYVRGSVAYTITGGTFMSNGPLFGFSGATGASLNITGGTFIIKGNGNGAFVAKPGSAGSCTVTIDGGLFVNSSTANIENVMVAASLAGENTIMFVSGKVLYKENVTNMIIDTPAPKTESATYDVNGNGVIDEDETFYVYKLKSVRKISFPATNSRYSGEMEKGAAVRIAEGGNGLKFTAVYSAAVIKNLDKKAETGSEIFYGMLIFPTEQFEEMETFQTDDLLALIEVAGCTHLVGGNGAQVTVDESGNVILQGAITGITDETVSYSAVSYVCLKTGKESSYYFTAYNMDDNARSARDIAEAALADTETEYTEAQTAILQTYLAPAESLQLPASEGTFVLLTDARKKRWF